MRCEKCNINLYGDVDICPLCHNKIISKKETLLADQNNNVIEGEQTNNSASTKAVDSPIASTSVALYYPPKRAKKHIHTHFTLNSIYLFVSMLIFLACITINYLLDTSFLWCYLVGAAALYGYIIIAHTVQSHSGVGTKIFVQGCSVAFLSWLVQIIIHKKNLIFNYNLPIILGCLILVLAGFLIFTARHNRSLLLSSILLSLIGYIPIILYACGVATVLIPSLITAILASITLIGTVAFGIFDLREQFSKVFHI